MSSDLSTLLSGLRLGKPTATPHQPREPKFKKDLPYWKLQIEFKRKVALECSQRCMMHRAPREGEVKGELKRVREIEMVAEYTGIEISQSEQLCLNRCINKLHLVKEIVDSKISDHVELPPILFNQNLP